MTKNRPNDSDDYRARVETMDAKTQSAGEKDPSSPKRFKKLSSMAAAASSQPSSEAAEEGNEEYRRYLHQRSQAAWERLRRY